MMTPPSQSLAMTHDTLWGLANRNPTPTTTRALQENRYKPINSEAEKSKPAAGTSDLSSSATSGLRKCFKCGKPEHMSRDCKQTNSKIHHVGADEYDYKDRYKEEEATHDEEQKNY
ncbi:hypothetical protein DSO57_1026069 [Entomophthora muscae]|uniref:Uncharacterized protein n=1 Tax=Entomophthora muscae TaxID=34485 RepID=A0ACC2UCB6_9FUNG|nr:hypothetical protein DSO57_1026069 [Entomophthora muscae]